MSANSAAFLSICIPTYNRAACLRQCLKGLYAQLGNELINAVEIIVSDNASTDDTSGVAEEYLGYKNFSYYRNDSNLGMDGNFYACYKYAAGKFVWIFSDDDFLLPGALSLIVDLLKKNQEIGVCYLNSEWVDDIETTPIRHINSLQEKFYTSSEEFIAKVNYWVTFLTGNIFNKSLVHDKIYPEENMGTLFVQLSWIFPAIFYSKKNVIVGVNTIVCKANNTGGYKLFEVFGANLNSIMDRMVTRNVITKSVKDLINRKLISSFFPPFISSKNASFKAEDVFFALLKVFWPYRIFWTKLVPVIFVNKIKRK